MNSIYFVANLVVRAHGGGDCGCMYSDSKFVGGGRLHGVSNKRSRSSISSDVSRA